MKPLVSILIPAYKVENLLPETLRSVLAQTYPHKEIIVVVDGSPDNTLAVAKGFESQGVRVFDQKNAGAAAARNAAFSFSTGDYIQWLDADDLLSPDKIEKAVEALGDNPNKRIVASSGWGHFRHSPNRVQFIPTSLWTDLSPAEWFMRQMEENIFMQTATWLVSREVTEAAGPWDTRLLGDDDGEYFSRVRLASDGIRFVPEGKVYYRVPGVNSLSWIGTSNKKLEAQWLSMRLHIEYLRSLDDGPRARAACVTYLGNWMRAFYPERMDLFEQAVALASELGGKLDPPRLSWKYETIRSLFGWSSARRAQATAAKVRATVEDAWEKALYQMEAR